MEAASSYVTALNRTTSTFLQTQWDALSRTAEKIADCYACGGMFFVLGTGHSHMVAEEFFYRAGGLARVCPILDEGLMLHCGAAKSSAFERLPGYAQALLDRYELRPGDVILIASNSGRNAVPVEAALLAKERGLFVVALTSLQHSKAVESRHNSGKRLFEIADIVLDNCGVYGDAAVEIDGVGRMGATSSVIDCMAAQLLGVMTAQAMVERQLVPEIFISANTNQGDAHNDQLLKKYAPSVKSL